MYNVKYACYNCGHIFKQYFTKGEKAPHRITCPNCGVFEARKCWANTAVRKQWYFV